VRFGDGQTAPRTYTVGAGDETSDLFATIGATSYDLSVSGPNGFLHRFAGGLAPGSANLAVHAMYDKDEEGIALVIQNDGMSAEKVSILDGYSGKTQLVSCTRKTLLPTLASYVNPSAGTTSR
jgi:phospholipase C